MNDTRKKTKIVATIGPGSEYADIFSTLLKIGVNVARTNMSHDDQVIHKKRIKMMRMVSKRDKTPVAILMDLAGPKIRIGDFEEGAITLISGQQFILSGKKCMGTAERVYFNYPYIKKDIKPGMTLMLDDGRKKLIVTKVEGTDIYTTVLVGGHIKNRRGVNIPGAYLSINALTEKDKSDALFGIAEGVDFFGLSFVRTANDIKELRGIIKKQGGTQAIIAKIETQEAVENIDAIIMETDAVMIARGDLAVEIGPEKVPNVQKMIIKKCNEVGKPVIVATQMLESMIAAPVPTRAEVSDVANAIFDGADAVMLSEETALGKFAIEAVTTMGTVARQVESGIESHRRLKVHTDDIADSVSSSVVHNAEDVHAKVIVGLTESGLTARLLARYKPRQIIVAMTPHAHIARQLLLVHGCYPLQIKSFRYVGQIIDTVGRLMLEAGYVQKGDRMVVAAGVPFGVAGTTNMMMILKI